MTAAHRSRLAFVIALAGLVTLTGCTVGPDTGPKVVHGDGGGDRTDDKPKLPTLRAPKSDLNYAPCGDKLDDYGVDKPKDVLFDCATYDVPVDPQKPGGDTLTVGVVRARMDATPKDAVPLVLTSGSDLPSSRLLLTFTADRGRQLLERHPIVAVDRRGTGLSSPVDCLTRDQRETFAANGADDGRDVAARTTALAKAARTGADICNDTLNPNQLQYSTATAAEDLEALRSRWDVDRMALVGVGSGSSVVLAYAGAHPGHVGRLVLDSPVGFHEEATQAYADRAAGVNASLATFAQRCSNVGCALGPDGLATLRRVVSSAATGGVDGLTDTSVLNAVTTALAVGDDSPAGLRALGHAIADADRNDTAALVKLAQSAELIRSADGQYLARCNDMVGRPGLDDIPELAKDWAKDSALTATSTALDLARCDGWGVADAPKSPTSFAVVPLILAGANDPINGRKSGESVLPLLISAGADVRTITWDGLGYSVLARSDCAAATVDDYLGGEPPSGQNEQACPG
ncbi:MAG: alpha/beta fold hydrolase [Gordonia sp. (in: high G+C Gram-positive bacteria)]